MNYYRLLVLSSISIVFSCYGQESFQMSYIKGNYQTSTETKKELFNISVNNKIGLINSKGEVIVTPQYDFIDNFYEDRAVIKKGNLFGYIDKNGIEIIPAAFEKAFSFRENRAIIYKDGKCGYIDNEGNIIIKPTYGDGYFFFEGFAAVKQNGEFGFIDKNGLLRIPIQFDGDNIDWMLGQTRNGYGFHEGLAPVAINGKYGFINTSGKIVIELKYDYCVDFKNGFARVEKNNKWGYVDKNGKEIIPIAADECDDFYNNVALVSFNVKKGIGIISQRGIITKDGNWILKPNYSDIYSFSNSGGLISDDKGKIWLIDNIGNKLKMAEYDVVNLYENGVAIVTKFVRNDFVDDKSSLIDNQGNLLFPLKDFLIKESREGIGVVFMNKGNQKYGYVDRTGEVIIPPIYDLAYGFEDGIAKVVVGNEFGYINKKGEYVWKPSK